jgi:lipopolysaccharide/colanic/teichoic acid biosynthesis glycosyltransferase
MTDPPEGSLEDELRTTYFGRLLRSTSLDELPQLINVLKGEMSLIGPRPQLLQLLTEYTGEQIRRHEVRPGITGLAQINGRNSISWEQKFQYDVWYVDHANWIVDMKILARTPVSLFAGDWNGGYRYSGSTIRLRGGTDKAAEAQLPSAAPHSE